ncbi:hypothetical protein SAMN05216486_1363 [bacterium JGI 053]|nr:hypothetical protein SAMN05216486_1363 [bacterium JGI 053]
MRASRGAVAVGIGLVLPVLFACASPPRDEQQQPVVAAFVEGTGAGAQARHPGRQKARTDLEACRRARQQGVYPRERSFPCEAFLGE